MADSSHVVQVIKSETESERNDSVTISLGKDQTIHDNTNTDRVEIKIKDDNTSRKIKPSYAVFRMKLVSEVMDTKIVDGSKKNTVGQDVSGMQSKLRKNIYVYQGGEMDYEGDDPDDRNEFVRMVFSICGVMLLVVFIATLVIYMSPGISGWMRGTMMGLIIFGVCAVVISAISYIYCCFDCSRRAPVNWCLNILVTLCYCYLCGFICAKHAPIIILGALFSTLVVVAVCLGLAYTSFDFTKFLLLVVIAMVALTVASIFCTILKFAFGMKVSFIRIILTIISAVVGSLLLVIEFQMILGGKSIELSQDEYVYGAYMIFTSIISLFLKLLRIIAYFYEY